MKSHSMNWSLLTSGRPTASIIKPNELMGYLSTHESHQGPICLSNNQVLESIHSLPAHESLVMKKADTAK